MKKKIKILYVLNNLRTTSGITSFVMTYFKTLNKAKYQVDFVILQKYESPYYKEIKNNGGKVFVLTSLRNPILHLKACYKLLKFNQYQIIHDNLLISSIPIMMVAFLTNVPVRILQSHNTRLSSEKWKAIRNKIALPFLKVTANTYFACGRLAGESLFGDKPFTVIPNTVSSSKFKFNESTRIRVRDKYKCAGKLIIGTVARVNTQKNPFFALKIIESLIKVDPRIQYWWIGSGELDSQVQKYIYDHNLSKHIKLFSSCDHVSELYQAMDAFLLPSLFEGLPIVYIEAQANGLPCVISNSVTKEIVYTDLVDFISLSSSVEIWANSILKQSMRCVDRTFYAEKALKVSPYYLPKATNELERKYVQLVRYFN